MSEQTRPVLSIGIIFRDNIRSIERCLKALQPLRDAIPCELVMADTGSQDGSRAVAEQYADVLFDFPWINDFAAARNAVIDHASGEWYLSVDTDEYLDEDISELLNFLRTADESVNLARVNIRNYTSYEMDGAYSDFYTLRLVRLSIGARYKGAIHEAWSGLERGGHLFRLAKTIFHHDGYVKMSGNKEKLDRNMALLRKKLKENPQSLGVRLQVIESGVNEEDYEKQVRRAVALLLKKPDRWRDFGPPILRYAVYIAKERNMPEFQEWVDRARAWFPDSYYTRLDVNWRCIVTAYEAEDYAACISPGEEMVEAYADFRAGRGDVDCQVYSTLQVASPVHEQSVHLTLAACYLNLDIPEKAMAHLEAVDYTLLNGSMTSNLAKALCMLQSKSELDTRDLVRAAWEGVTAPKPSEKRAEERRRTFLLVGSACFTPAYRENEAERGRRHSYTAFTPLAGKCGLGTAAAILEAEDPAEIAGLLEGVESWGELPFPALSHAILAGTTFPLPSRRMNVEELDALAGRLAGDMDKLRAVVEKCAGEDFTRDWQALAWTRGLALTAVQHCVWKDEKADMELARTFMRVERAFIAGCYSPEVLREESIFVLPPMHRFAWYCGRALEALESGDSALYARCLRMGLETCPQMKPMVEFLSEHTPQLQGAQPDAELLELAEKVRDMLAACAPDDPAVAMLKQSAAYQKVAYLIEGLEVPVMGGLPS